MGSWFRGHKQATVRKKVSSMASGLVPLRFFTRA